MENDVNYDLDYDFNPDNVTTEDTINAVFVVDVSSSVRSYVNELNSGINDFVERMKVSHVAPKLFASIVEFSDKVKVRTGFQPISQIPTIDFSSAVGGTTALYDGTKLALDNAINYREGLENAGVNCKTLVFVITDGEDNASKSNPSEVKDKIDTLLSEERNYASFESILFGIGAGNGMDRYFTQAAQDMGIKNVATISDSASDIKKMINFISSSVSSASAGGTAISTPNF